MGCDVLPVNNWGEPYQAHFMMAYPKKIYRQNITFSPPSP